MSKLGELSVELSAKTAKLDKALLDTQKKMRKFESGFANLGKSLTRKLTLPLLALGAVSVKAFADFDKAMTESLAIMGDVSDVMRKDMVRAAKEMSTKSTFAAKELAGAYFFLASAGMNAAQSIKALPVVAKFAQAGTFDLARATDLLTDAQTALGLSSKDVAKNQKNMIRVSDVLVKANTLANASVEQFSEALTNRAAAALRMLGKELEEGVAVLAAFADQGRKGSEAGEALSIVMRDLQKAAIKNKAAFKASGVAVFDAQGEMRNMADIIGDLEGLLEGMSDEQKKATLTMLGFQERSQANIITLTGMSDKIREYEKNLKRAGGTTEEVYRKQLETFSNKLKIVRNRITNVAMEIGEVLVPMLEKVMDKIAATSEKFKELAKWKKEAAVKGGLLAAALGPVMIGLASVIKSAGVLKGALVALAGSPIGLVITGLGYIAERAWAATRSFKAMFNELDKRAKASCEKMGWLEKAFYGVHAAYSKVIGGFDYGKAATKDLAAQSKEIGTVQDRLKTVFNHVSDAVEAQNAVFLMYAKTLFGFREDAKKTKKAVAGLTEAIDTQVNASRGVVAAWNWWKIELVDFNTIMENTQDTLQNFPTETALAARNMTGVLKNAKATIETSVFKPYYENIEKMRNRWTAALSSMAMTTNILADEIGGAFGNITSNFALALDQIANYLDNLGENAKVTFQGVAKAIGSVLAGQIGGSIGQAISGAKKSFAAIGSALGSAVGMAFGGKIGSIIGSAAGGLFGGLFKKKQRKTEEQRLAEQFNEQVKEHTQVLAKFGKITESTSKAIAESRKSLKGFAAISKHFASVISDVGVTQDNVNKLWDRATEIIYHVRDGFLDASSGSKALNESFRLLVEGARELGQEGSEDMLEFIRATRETGVEVKAVTDYVTGQLDRIPSALSTLVSNAKGKGFDKLAKIADVTFQAMIAEGRSFMDSLKAMQSPLSALQQKYKETGQRIPEYLKPMFDMLKKMEVQPEIFQNIDAATTVLHSLKNTAYLTQGAFDSLTGSTTEFAQAILGVKGNLDTALRGMKLTQSQIQQLLPTVSQFVGAAAAFGLGVPAWMKTFVTEQLGVDWNLFEETVKTQANSGVATVEKLQSLLDSLKDQKTNVLPGEFWKLGNRLTNSIEELNRAVCGEFGDLADNLGGISDAVDDVGRKFDKIPSAASGFHGTVSQPQMMMVHPNELINITPFKDTSKPSSGGTTVVNKIQIHISDQIDPFTAKRIMREKMLPELIDAIESNYAGSKTKLREAQGN